MRQLCRALSCALVVAVTTGGLLFGTSAPASAATISTLESRMVAKINHARAYHGLRTLKRGSHMMRHSRRHSQRMAADSLLFHTKDFSIFACWDDIAENVGMGSSIRSINRAFMNSPAHRANILTKGMRYLGVGVARGDGYLWVTEVFRNRC
jgi:uncharacterized protein YkwD